ncbi:MAG: AI-2E family transporter, partial [Clostridia bacterium]|nr:AI-2E family transporter [Clostridia bacterium]
MDPKLKKRLLAVMFVFLGVFILANLSGIAAVLGFTLDVTMPILVGFAIAFVLNIPLRFLEKLWRRIPHEGWQRFRRPICLVLTLLLVAGIIALLLVVVLPPLVETILELLRGLPDEIGTLQSLWGKLSELAAGFSIHLPPLNLDHEKIAAFLGNVVEEYGHKLMEVSFEVILSTLTAVLETLVAVVLSIYVLAKKERIGGQVKKFLHALLPNRYVDRILGVASLSSKTFGKFLTGQLTEAV